MYIDLTDDSNDYAKFLQSQILVPKKHEDNSNESINKGEKDKNISFNQLINEKYFNIQIDLENLKVIADKETKSVQDFFELEDSTMQKFKNSKENFTDYLQENLTGDIDIDGNFINIENPYSTLAIMIKTEHFNNINSLGNADYVTKISDSLYIINYKNAIDTKNGYNLLKEDTEVERVVKDSKLLFVENDEISINNAEEISTSEKTTTKFDKYAWGIKTTGLYKYVKYVENLSNRPEVKVAVVDKDGISVTHEVFKNRIDTINAYNYKDKNTNVIDNNGHGTAVASLIAEATPSNVLIVPAVISGSVLNMTAAMKDLANKVDIINCSVGAYVSDVGMSDWNAALSEVTKNTIVVCSAGNDGDTEGKDYDKHYPSASPYTISVGATDKNRNILEYSNYGKTLDFAAPGKDIEIAYYMGDNTYVTGSGTSFSSPLVAASFALLKTEYPSYSNEQLKNELINNCDDLGEPGKDYYYGNGEINFFKNKFSTPAVVELDSEEQWGKTESFNICVTGINNIKYMYDSTSSTLPTHVEWIETPTSSKFLNIKLNADTNGTHYIWFKDENGNISEGYQYTVSYVDDIHPTISEGLSSYEITQNSFKVKFKASDKQTGIIKIKWYCKLENEENYSVEEITLEEPSFETIEKTLSKTGLNSNSSSQIYAEIYDAAGNFTRTNEIVVTTSEAEVINNITSISVQTAPTKLTYIKGEDLVLDGGKIKVIYQDLTTSIIDMIDSEVSVTGYNSLELGKQTLTVTYKGKTTTFEVQVKNDLIKIEIKNKPNKTIYFVGETFKKDGMKVIAIYEDNTIKEVDNYEILEDTDLTLEVTSVTIRYTENGISKTVEQQITVIDKSKEQLVLEGQDKAKPGEKQTLKVSLYSEKTICSLSGIIDINEFITEISLTELNGWKSEYNSNTGEFKLDKLKGGQKEEILNIEFTTSNKEGNGSIKLTNIIMTTNEKIEIEVEDVHTTIAIKAPVVLTAIKIVQNPNKLIYAENEKFDTDGMKIIAEFSDGTTKEITNYKYFPEGNLKVNDDKITIVYAEEGIQKEVELSIKVNTIPEENENNKNNYNPNIPDYNNDNTVADKDFANAGLKNIILISIVFPIIISLFSYIFINIYKDI